MISRIGFICYTQNVPLQKMADRIVMITFTNEAADQMEEKLKAYFKNCYLVTSKPDYLQMISQIDHMQISTIHSYAKNLIAQMGTSFGYGIDLSITSSEFYRRKRSLICLMPIFIKKKWSRAKTIPTSWVCLFMLSVTASLIYRKTSQQECRHWSY